MAPIDLGLLPGRVFRRRYASRQSAGPVVQHQITAEMVFAARVTALAHHGIEAAGGKPRVLLQGGTYKGQEGVELQGRSGSLQLGEPGLGQHPVHCPMVHPQLAGDGAHQPLLHMKVTQDLRFEFRRDSHRRLLARATPGPWLRASRPPRGWLLHG